MRDRGLGTIAIAIVEWRDIDGFERPRFDAAHVDVDAIGIRARHVETFDAAMTAEKVFRGAGVERVFGQIISPDDEAETRRRDDQVQESTHAADRAVAVERLDPRWRVDFEMHRAAVTTATMCDQSLRHVDSRELRQFSRIATREETPADRSCRCGQPLQRGDECECA